MVETCLAIEFFAREEIGRALGAAVLLEEVFGARSTRAEEASTDKLTDKEIREVFEMLEHFAVEVSDIARRNQMFGMEEELRVFGGDPPTTFLVVPFVSLFDTSFEVIRDDPAKTCFVASELLFQRIRPTNRI